MPNIKNEAEFLERFDEIFDDKLIKEIIAPDPDSNWTTMGWRGTMLYGGTVWIDEDFEGVEGKLYAINRETKKGKELKGRLILEDKMSLHESLRDFKKPVEILKTEKFRIRIDKLEQSEYRYTSWPVNKEANALPDVCCEMS